jgi:hypothetical protein
MLLRLLFLAVCVHYATSNFMTVQGRNFMFAGQHVHLSGPNLAWYRYAWDFGNNEYSVSGPVLEQWVREISAAGGNCLRVWIHIEAEHTPEFDGNGFVIAPDRLGTIINDMSRFLDVAAANNVFVIPVLWNGALMRNQRYRNLVLDDARLQSYIDNSLIPMVRALSTKRALASWEIMNEPEGSVLIAGDGNPCFSTSILAGTGAGWTGVGIPMFRFLRFINRQAGAIRRTDTKALVSTGSWSEISRTDAFSNTHNYYKDTCLIQAGGDPLGTLSFDQIHTYSWEGRWNNASPFRHHANNFQLNKPLVIGEFSSACSENEGVDALWNHSYNNGYAGTWSWQYNAGGHCSDNQAQQRQGMTRIRHYTHNGRIAVNINA